MQNKSIAKKKSTLRLPGIIAGACSGLTLSSALHSGLKMGLALPNRSIRKIRQFYQPNESLISVDYYSGEKAIITQGKQRRKVPDVRTRIAYYLSREIGISKAEIALELGTGISIIAMAIMRKESRNRN